MILLLNQKGDLVDYGTKKDVRLYVKLGYIVKVLNESETAEYKAKMKIKNIWYELPTVLKKRVKFLLSNQALSWVERYNKMIRILGVIVKRASTFTITHRIKYAGLVDKLRNFVSDAISFFKFLTARRTGMGYLALDRRI
jgi:hypothetical protein